MMSEESNLSNDQIRWVECPSMYSGEAGGGFVKRTVGRDMGSLFPQEAWHCFRTPPETTPEPISEPTGPLILDYETPR